MLVGELERPASGESAKVRLRSRVKAVVPRRVVRLLRPTPHAHISTRAVGYRAYVASRMAAILREDAAALEAGR